MHVQKNDVVDYYDGRKISCGLILDLDDRRLRLLTDQGKEVKISPNRVLISEKHPQFPLVRSRDDQVRALKEISARREELKGRIDLKELWEVVGPETGEIDSRDLAELVFSARPDPDGPASLLRAIFEDRLYFKIRPEGIEIPSPERVEQALLQREKERERQNFVARSAELLARLKDSEEIDPASAPEGLIEMLEEAALYGREWAEVKPIKDMFSHAGLGPRWDPFRVLVKLGVWHEDENVSLRAERIPVEFSPEAEKLAGEAALKPLPAFVEDLSDRNVITIDSEFTRDVDDALSIEHEGDDVVIGIHITDVANFVEHDSELDAEIRQRATSIYLPEMTIPMIPPVLSEQAASLSVGQARPALSVMVRLGSDFSVKDFRIVRSKILVRERLSYEEADARILEADSAEAKMFAVASALREGRVASGALIFKDLELSVRIAEDGDIEVSTRDRETPAQILVSEMMILANNLFARFMRDQKLPGIYRVQPPPLEKVELSERHDPVLSYRCKKSLARGSLGTEPEPHSTLGLDVYTTATSPLRRYPDLLVQRQVISALDTGRPLLSRDELDRILDQISYRVERAALVERERQRYFLLKYLMAKRRGDEFEAVVLQKFPRFHLVQITEFGINAALNTPNNLALNPHDRAIIRIEKISPREDKLSLALVKLL
ncbi:MAG: RNB domain-containing ribonuclease [Desulfomonile tiedjei]|nr:RNB domain-containing ribonuclease [Desulfomonile tiedjei]